MTSSQTGHVIWKANKASEKNRYEHAALEVKLEVPEGWDIHDVIFLARHICNASLGNFITQGKYQRAARLYDEYYNTTNGFDELGG